MAIVCYICKKEVRLVRFGSGFVGTCCNYIMYNSAIEPDFDRTEENQNNISVHSLHQEIRCGQTEHS
jgi:hypothetical protein